MFAGFLASVSLYGWWEYSVGTQRDAVAAINRAGGVVYYDWAWVNGRPLTWGARPRAPEWAVNALGRDFFGHIVAVQFDTRGLRLDDAVMTNVGKLGRLESLSLDRTAVTDEGLAHLRDLTRLKRLSLYATPVSASGLAHLERMVELEELMLPELTFADADLAHLAGLHKLRGLSLSGKGITNAGIAHLRSMTSMDALGLCQTSVTSLESIRALTQLTCIDMSNSTN